MMTHQDQSHDEKKVVSGEDVSFAKDYLDTTTDVLYYEGLNAGTGISLDKTKEKLKFLLLYTDLPRKILSVGVGSGEEVQALIEMFMQDNVTVYGLDLSSKALEFAQERLDRLGLHAVLVEGSAINLPFVDNTIDGIVMSAILHEIYSYVPNGKEAWMSGIREVAKKLSPNGIFLLRDFAAPSSDEISILTAKTPEAENFYTYFREYYRTFSTWEEHKILEIADKRSLNAMDFPALNSKSKSVHLPRGKIAEMLLHFRNFLEDNIVEYSPSWKEINETYLVPSPTIQTWEVLSPHAYAEMVLIVSNKVLNTTNFEMRSVRSELSRRPETAKFISHHFSITQRRRKLNSLQLIEDMTMKMEYVFRKTERSKQ